MGHTHSRASDPIVVVGMGVEAPGGIESPADFWTTLTDGREAIGPMPTDRGWPLKRLLSSDTAPVGNAGGFLDRATEFDPTFFGITPREAAAMDPQQRVALRVAWRALEYTGIAPDSLAGQNVGCYIGASGTEYGPQAAIVNEYTGHRIPGSALGVISGRISHRLGLIGPSMTVDTVCASGLSALHLATIGIHTGECDWALAGGVCVMGSPWMFVEFAKLGALTAHGHCKSFSADADGTLWGEGAGVVVLEKLSRARLLGHRVFGRVLATGVNHNGNDRALIAPNTNAQQRLYERTLASAGIDAALVGMIEGHGTATVSGDRAELTALARVYGAANRTLLGSVKSNIGHTQSASGILGLIKVLLCGRHAQIAPSLFADRPSQALDWNRTGLTPAAKREPWPDFDGVRYGAVSAFGIGGTNAHALVAIDAGEVSGA